MSAALKADYRGRRHGEDRADEFPMEAGQRHHIAEIEPDAEQAEQDEIGNANRARDHDRRIGAAHFLVGDRKGCRRQPPPPFDLRAVGGWAHGGSRRGI